MAQIFLIGMPGCGKSSLGAEFSNVMQIPYLDLDELFEKNHGSIAKYWNKFGESAFRRNETDILLAQSDFHGIVATGGGVVSQAVNRQFLRERHTIYLQTSIDKLLNNIAAGERPLLSKDCKIRRLQLQKLLREREAIYSECADFSIDATQNQSELLKEMQNFWEGLHD